MSLSKKIITFPAFVSLAGFEFPNLIRPSSLNIFALAFKVERGLLKALLILLNKLEIVNSKFEATAKSIIN